MSKYIYMYTYLACAINAYLEMHAHIGADGGGPNVNYTITIQMMVRYLFHRNFFSVLKMSKKILTKNDFRGYQISVNTERIYTPLYIHKYLYKKNH